MVSVPDTSTSQKTLPEGWRWVKLGEVCEREILNKDPREFSDLPFHYIDISSIDNIRKRIVSPQNLLGVEAPSRARQVVLENDVLVSTTRPNLNAVALVPPELDQMICSTGFCVLRPTKAIDPTLLFLFVQSKAFVESLSALVVGALYPAVKDSQVKDQLIPLPPLPEQRRIAGILKEQMAAVEKARAAAEAQLQAAKALPAAYLRDVFPAPDAPLPEGWKWVKLGEVCGFVGGNTLPEFLECPEEERIYCLKVSDLSGADPDRVLPKDGKLYTSENRPLPRVLNAGAVVFPKRGGAIATNKKKMLAVRAVLDPNLMGVESLNEAILLPDYLYLWFMSWDLASIQSGNTVPQLNQQDLAPLEITLPPTSIQKKVVSEVSASLAKGASLGKSLAMQFAQINALPAALLRQAFSGEL